MNRVAAIPLGGGKTAVVQDEADAGNPGQKRKKTTSKANTRPRELSLPPASRLPRDSSGVLVDDFLQSQETFRNGFRKDMSFEEEKAWHMQRFGEIFAFHCDTQEKLEKDYGTRITTLRKEHSDLKKELNRERTDSDKLKYKVDRLCREKKSEVAKFKEKTIDAENKFQVELDNAARCALKFAEEGYELFRKNLRDLPSGGD